MICETDLKRSFICPHDNCLDLTKGKINMFWKDLFRSLTTAGNGIS